MTLDEKIQIFTEYLENGGYEKINHIDLLEDMKLVQKDANGKAIPSTISPLVMAAINSVAIAKSDSFQPEPIITDTFVENYKHLKQKNLYFSQEQIDTPEQFDAIFEELSKKENTLFRGVKESKWRLNSSLQRQWISNEYKTKGINYKEFLEKLIENARTVNNESLRRYLNALNLDSENDIAILSFLQHQGSESFTPLLDWTYKFEHSLFFAIDRMKSFSKSESESEIDNYFSIYYLEEEFFEDGDLTAIVQKVLDENSENIFNGLIESLDGPKEKVESFVN